MDPKVLETGTVDGVQVGAPIGVANFSIAVNPTVLEKAGVAMPDDKTWTWDDLAKISAQVTEKLGGDGIYGIDGFGVGAAELGIWARQKGEEVWPTDGAGPSQATVQSYFEYANELISTKAAPPASLQVENASAALDTSSFATNKAAFHLLFHTQISAFAAASGNELKLLRIPAQSSGESPKMVNKASMYWSIASRSRASRGEREAGRLPAHRPGRHQGADHGAGDPRDSRGTEGDRPAAGSAGEGRPGLLSGRDPGAGGATPGDTGQRVRVRHGVHRVGH